MLRTPFKLKVYFPASVDIGSDTGAAGEGTFAVLMAAAAGDRDEG